MAGKSTKNTMAVALGVSLICSFLVSLTAVALHDKQQQNRKFERIRNIVIAAGFDFDKHSMENIYKKNIRPVVVNMKTGIPIEKDKSPVDPENFDIETILKNSELTIPIPDDEDIASINKKPVYIVVYHVLNEGSPDRIVLPVYGKGLWSTMYGFISMDMDLTTIKGITFYQHGETPGLGGEIDNKKWQKSWFDKKAFDNSRHLKIEVIKGRVDKSKAGACYKIDGLSGATLTTRGVNAMVRFWLGKNGYGPYFVYLRGAGNE